MDTDSELEDYNVTQADPGILPRTPAEEVRMVDDTGDQDWTHGSWVKKARMRPIQKHVD